MDLDRTLWKGRMKRVSLSADDERVKHASIYMYIELPISSPSACQLMSNTSEVLKLGDLD